MRGVSIEGSNVLTIPCLRIGNLHTGGMAYPKIINGNFRLWAVELVFKVKPALGSACFTLRRKHTAVILSTEW